MAENRLLGPERVILLELTLVAVIGALALGLRLIALDRESLWLDEAGRVAIAGLPLHQIPHGVAVIELSPPLYHLLLHGWLLLWGQSDFALRLLSALLVLSTVPLVWALGRCLHGRMAGLGAALLAAVSPFAVHYGQEVAMYALLLPLGAAALLAASQVIGGSQRHRARWLGPYVILAVLGLYTHYYAGFLLAAVALTGSLHAALRHAWHGVAIWVAAHLVIALAFLPWLPVVWQQTRLAASVEDWQAVPPRDALLRWASALVADLSPSLDAELALGIVLAGLTLGLWRLRREPRGWLLGTVVLLPLILAILAGGFVHGFRERGFLVVLPAVWVLFAVGLEGPSRVNEVLEHANTRTVDRWMLVAGRVVFGVLLGASVLGLRDHFNERKEDFRAAATEVAAHANPDDPIFFVHFGAQLPFDHYFDGPQPRVGLPETFDWATGYTARYVVTPEDVGRRAIPRLSGARQAWAVLSHDGGRGSEHAIAALNRWGTRVEAPPLHGVRVLRYVRRG